MMTKIEKDELKTLRGENDKLLNKLKKIREMISKFRESEQKK